MRAAVASFTVMAAASSFTVIAAASSFMAMAAASSLAVGGLGVLTEIAVDLP